jgi:glycosyltransferase involved in cell wall biosynthesis
MLGAVPNDQLLGLFERAVFFLLPCVTEADGDQDGIPVAMMEAMACGVPTISTEISGIPELVEDGVNGVLVPQRDAQALASAMKRLLEDMDFAARLGEASRKRVCEEFDTEPNARLLRQLIASNKR